jgi:hypothetical protein
MLKLAVPIVAALSLLAACQTGQNFARPAPDAFMLGKATESEILSSFGAPATRRTETTSETKRDPSKTRFDSAGLAGSYERLIYIHADRTATIWVGAPPTTKGIAFTFLNGTLIMYDFSSNFEEDSSNFDESRVSALIKGTSTKADVVALFGQPTGRAIYPLIERVGDEVYKYGYAQTTRQERSVKQLNLLFDPEGVLVDFRFSSQSGPAPAPQGGGTVVTPVYVPRGK